jgi:hypothetical protein
MAVFLPDKRRKTAKPPSSFQYSKRASCSSFRMSIGRIQGRSVKTARGATAHPCGAFYLSRETVDIMEKPPRAER